MLVAQYIADLKQIRAWIGRQQASIESSKNWAQVLEALDKISDGLQPIAAAEAKKQLKKQKKE